MGSEISASRSRQSCVTPSALASAQTFVSQYAALFGPKLLTVLVQGAEKDEDGHTINI